MTNNEQSLFIHNLIRNVEQHILEKLQDIPGTWDEAELRQYIADKFDPGKPMDRKRRLEYNRIIATTNL
jgi:hypothetical protein